LERLADDPDEDVRRGVGENPSTPAAVLKRLAGDADEDVRRGVGWNPSTPVAVLEYLAVDPDEGVRTMVGRNPSVPPVVLAILADDLHFSIRLEAALNEKTLLEDLLASHLRLGSRFRRKLRTTIRHLLLCWSLRFPFSFARRP
jgi:hypothetical protein